MGCDCNTSNTIPSAPNNCIHLANSRSLLGCRNCCTSAVSILGCDLAVRFPARADETNSATISSRSGPMAVISPSLFRTRISVVAVIGIGLCVVLASLSRAIPAIHAIAHVRRAIACVWGIAVATHILILLIEFISKIRSVDPHSSFSPELDSGVPPLSMRISNLGPDSSLDLSPTRFHKHQSRSSLVDQ